MCIHQDSFGDIDRLGRLSSVGGAAQESYVEFFDLWLPVLFVWGSSAVAAIFITDWPLCIATVGVFLACSLVLLLPPLLYFNLGVTSDFQAIPVFGFVIPNRLFMSVTLTIGIMYLVGCTVVILFLVSGAIKLHVT